MLQNSQDETKSLEIDLKKLVVKWKKVEDLEKELACLKSRNQQIRTEKEKATIANSFILKEKEGSIKKIRRV